MAVITEENFKSLVNQTKFVMVLFYAKDCENCYKTSQMLYKLQTENAQNSVIKIDDGINKTLSDKYEIIELPTVLLFKNGKQIWRQSIEIEESEIKTMLH